ncbi:MAG: glutamate-semialdehyde--aminomutase [Phycisphaerales bacterium]|jgi:glutamate-1-semialdehyde 2,1-aminomutase|nr:glutamate-semialdehyde--aminomutase [Phycisphaerales bacterium]
MPEKTARTIDDSQAAFAKAVQLMPGGVSSPVRAFKAVGGTPLFIREAEGCLIRDIDGNEYIDYVASYGPVIAGHANERVVAALSKAIGRGTSFGAPTECETQLAEIIVNALPAIEMVRFVNSGTEAAMSAIRLARAATGRDLVVKCIGCYHGHVDGLLVEAGSGALTLGTPSSPGIPKSIAANTLLAPYNDLDGAKAVFAKHGKQIACFAVEPVAGNMGVVPPAPGYLEGLRALCDQHGALLLFDEVMTGFRVAWGGAQIRYGVKPDITCLGKVIGGGLPCAAYGGPRRIMELVSPAGPVYQAGTLSGNPLAMAGGIATLEILQEPGCYEALERRSAMLAEGLIDAAQSNGVPLALNRVGSMLTPFFTKATNVVTNFAQATAGDTQAYATFFHAMLDNGVYLAPSQYEAMFVGLAHTDAVIERTIKAAEKAFAAVREARKA